MTAIDPQALRRRIEVEDALLNTRTTIFLAVNGLWMAAMGVETLVRLRVAVVATGLVLSLVWFICGRQSRNVIAALTVRYITENPDDQIEDTVRKALWPPGWRSPTDLLGWELPSLFIAVWTLLLASEIFGS